MKHTGKHAPGLEGLLVEIGRLDNATKNPRRGNIEAVMRSYETFGQRKPLVVKRGENGRGTVLAGNHQLEAARQLGWTHVAVVWVDDDEQTAKAFALADNRTHDMGTYDVDALLELIDALNGEAELLAAIAFDEEALADLAIKQAENQQDGEAPVDLEALAARFTSMSSRMLVAQMSNDEFVWLQKAFAKFCETHKVSSNAEALVKMLEDMTGSKAPSWS